MFKERGRASGAPCWLCGGTIDYERSGEPLSHTVDHAVPVSVRPDLECDMANFRHAHFSCNSGRGNREVGRRVSVRFEL